jgi:GNAT superfamily N-acetyltransferase
MRILAGDQEIEVRPGSAEDVPLLLSFIRSLAEFEKLEVTATEDGLAESLFGERPAAQTLLAFVDGRPAAYAVYFFVFSTMVGRRGLWLEDLFVNPQFRGKGIAQALMSYLARVAIENHCARFDWMVLDWNRRAIDFYRGLGAAILSDWQVCRLDQGAIAALAERITGADNDR